MELGSAPADNSGAGSDLGFEIRVEDAHAEARWDALIEGGPPYGLAPVGVWGMGVARIEAGLILLDVDYYSAHHFVTVEHVRHRAQATVRKLPFYDPKREKVWFPAFTT